jgi:VWFA-related protein
METNSMRILCSLVLTIATIAGAQVTVPIPKPVSPPEATSSTKGPLDLDVVVSGHDGKAVAGLQQQDFSVYLDKEPQPITGFRAVAASSADAAPVQIILLVDTVNTRFSNVAYERQQIDRFLKQNEGKLSQPITLVILSDTSVQISQPSQDGNQLAGVLDKAATAIREVRRNTGFYGWTEQFQISASALQRLAAFEQTRPGRKLLIWISPGWPLLSGPEVQLSGKDQQNLFNTLVSLSASLRQARITLSSVDPLGTEDAISYQTDFYQEFTKGVTSARNMQIGNLALQVLALQSGGRVLNASNDVTAQIALAASDAACFYTLKINSPPSERPNEYRAISVSVDKPGLKARTRTGYYAQP